MSDAVEESYALCRTIARRAAKNFFYSFLLLPRDKRRGMYALYAFLRRTDDLADNDEPLEARREKLAAWRLAFDEALVGRSADPILPALVDTVTRFSIPREYLTAAIDGCEMDLGPVTYATFDDLALYCHRVASVVGLACIHVWGFDGPEALEPARKCGIAFQLTNILRDLGEDARGGRVYLPEEDLARFEYSRDDLTRGVCDERFRALVRFEAERAERYYREAMPLFDWLRPEGRSALAAMYGIYHALLDEVRRRPDTVLQRRISLPAWRKLWLMGAALPQRFRSAARGAVREAGL